MRQIVTKFDKLKEEKEVLTVARIPGHAVAKRTAEGDGHDLVVDFVHADGWFVVWVAHEIVDDD